MRRSQTYGAGVAESGLSPQYATGYCMPRAAREGVSSLPVTLSLEVGKRASPKPFAQSGAELDGLVHTMYEARDRPQIIECVPPFTHTVVQLFEGLAL